MRQSKLDGGGGEMPEMNDLRSKKKHAQKVPAKDRMNRRSQVPAQMRHEQKCEASSDSSDADADGESSDEGDGNI